MRKLLCGLLLVAGIAQAQAQIINGAMFMPNPLGIVLSAGEWIMSFRNKVYYIEVAGDGATPEQARQNGFRLAVEQAIGSLISSEAEVQNGRLIRDEIINYSAGYVDRFEIVSTSPHGSGTRVVMKVWVGRSALANRLLNESKVEGEVDGATAAVSLSSTLHEKVAGDKLLQSVLNDFPRRAYDIEIGRSRVVLNANRQAQLEIPFSIRFSQHYLDSLWAALVASQNKQGTIAEITLQSPGFFSAGGTVKYSDDEKFYLLSRTLIQSKPMVRVNLLSSDNRVVFTDLYNIPGLTHDGIFLGVPRLVDPGYRPKSLLHAGNASSAPFQMLIDGRASLKNTALVTVDPELLSQISRVQITVERQ